MADTTHTDIAVTLASGEVRRLTRSTAAEVLSSLHEFYSRKECEWYEKAYKSDHFSIDIEQEWIRYSREAAALKIAIDVLSDEEKTHGS